MPAPETKTRTAVSPKVYARKNVDGDHDIAGGYEADGFWRCNSVQLGAKERIGTASIDFNRARIELLDQTVPEPAIDPFLPQDAMFAVGLQDATGTGATILFEGSVSNLSRTLSKDADTGLVELQHAHILYQRHPEETVFGRFMAHIANDDAGIGKIEHDEGQLCTFNAGGMPNRSNKTALDTTGHLGVTVFGDGQNPDVHYFTGDNGWDIHEDAGKGQRRRARYWTAAQAIAYILNFHARSRAFPLDPGPTPNATGIVVWYGSPAGNPVFADPFDPRIGTQNESTVWGAIIGGDALAPIYKLEAVGADYEDGDTPPVPPAFSALPQSLLTTKLNDVTVNATNTIEAIGIILRSAGLGWYFDSFQPYSDIDTAPDPINHIMRVWTPGGELVGTPPNETGIGGIFYPKIMPFKEDVSELDATEIFARNTVTSMTANFDNASLNNRPRILMAPRLYEITIELRPGWEPIKEDTLFWIDSIRPIGQGDVFIDSLGEPHERLTNASAEADIAFRHWFQNPDFYVGANAEATNRIKLLARSLHSKGDLYHLFEDVLRKWVVPTDLRYPNSVYARHFVDGTGVADEALKTALLAAGHPAYWFEYHPYNFESAYVANQTGCCFIEGDPTAQPTAIPDLFIVSNRQQCEDGSGPGIPAHGGVWLGPKCPCPDIIPDPNVTAIPGFLPIGPSRNHLDVPSSADWPHRPRPFLPTLTGNKDSGSLGVVCELSFDNGCTWQQWSAFSTIPDECGIVLSFENPFDVQDTRKLDPDDILTVEIYRRSNLIQSLIHGKFRVRVTATIEGSDPVKVDAPEWSEDVTTQTRVIDRRNKYGIQTILSQFADKVTDDPQGFEDPIFPNVVQPGYLGFFFRPVDDTVSATNEAIRHQAWGADVKASGLFRIDWIELDARPGLVVPFLSSVAADGGGFEDPGDRGIDFRTDVGDGSRVLAPHINGVIFTFTAGGESTEVTIEDWRALSALGPAE